MAGLLDAMLNSSGQERRAWLDGKAQQALDWMHYYAGPHLSPAIDAGIQMGAMAMPSADLMDMAEGSRDLMGGDAMGGLAMMGGGLAGVLIPGTYSGARQVTQEAAKLASRQKTFYNLPTGSEVGDALGRSGSGGVDLEGRPLVARYVVGGAPERSGDQSLPAEALAEIIAGQTRDGLTFAPPRQLRGGAFGQARFSPVNRTPLGIDVADNLTPLQSEAVIRHEFGHLVDEIAGQIPTKGLSGELEPLFHYGVEGRDRSSNLTLPKHLKYSPDEAPREYMAEAIRQYTVAPDTMKQQFPKVAASIRKAVNANPRLNQMIQFNMPAGAAIGGAGLMGLLGWPDDQDQHTY